MNLSKKMVLAIFIFLALVRFWPFLFGNTVYFGDNFSLIVPGKIYTAQAIRSGLLPFWNNTILGGIPWLGDINQSVLYPTSLLFVLFTPGLSLSLSILLHLVIGMIGMLLLVKQWITSTHGVLISILLWVFSPIVLSSINNLSILQSLVWIPFVLWASNSLSLTSYAPSRYLALFLALQIYAGYPPHLIYTVLASFFLVTVNVVKTNQRKLLFRYFIGFGLGILLAAPVLLPFLETYAASTRTALSTNQTSDNSLAFSSALQLLNPSLFSNPKLGVSWGPSWGKQSPPFLFFGWVGLLLLGLQFKERVSDRSYRYWLIALLLVVFYSFGERLPIYPILTKMLPFLSFDRYPGMALLFIQLWISLLVGISIDNISKRRKDILHFIKLRWLSSFWVFGLTATFFVWKYFDTVWSFVDLILHTSLTNSVFHTLERDRLIFLMIAASTLLYGFLLLAGLSVIKKRKFFWLVPIVFTELYASTWGMFFYASNDIYSPQLDSGILTTLDSPHYRTLTRNFNYPYTGFDMYADAMSTRTPFSDSFVDSQELEDQIVLRHMASGITPNWNMPNSILLVNGYTTLLPKTIGEIFSQEDESRINFLPTIAIDHPLLDSWSVGHMIVDQWHVVNEAYSSSDLVWKQDALEIYERPTALDRFRYLDDSPVNNLSILESVNTIHLSFESSQITSLVVADRYDKNWKAYVNGLQTSIENYKGMRAIPMPSGEIILEMKYIPVMFYWGIVLSFLGIFVLVFISYYSNMSKVKQLHL